MARPYPVIEMARGRGRGTRNLRGKQKQQSRRPSPARKRRKLVENQSNSEACSTSSDENAGSKQRAPRNAPRSASQMHTMKKLLWKRKPRRAKQRL